MSRLAPAAAILQALHPVRTCCVVGHVRPDGDCVGSQLALAWALQRLGKKVVCWNEDPLPRKFAFLDPQRLFAQPRRVQTFDCVVATDCASYERLGKVRDFIGQRRLLLNIDHHASNTRYGDVNWIVPRDPSTGEILFRLFRRARWPLTPEIADALFTAISTDTGSFQYPSTRPGTLRAAAALLQAGAHLERICHQVYQSLPLPHVRLVQQLYRRFQLAHQNQIAWFQLNQADYQRVGALPEDSEGLIDHLRSLDTVVLACLFEEIHPGLTRISLRSKSPRINVSTLAGLFGGGGHPAAAGARIAGPGATVRRRVLAALHHALDSNPC